MTFFLFFLVHFRSLLFQESCICLLRVSRPSFILSSLIKLILLFKKVKFLSAFCPSSHRR